MSTMPTPISHALFSKSQAAVLGLLYGHPDEAYYLRQLVRLSGLGVGHLQRELDRLTRAGIIRRYLQGRHVYFQADRNCPIFENLRGIVAHALGPVPLLRAALAPLQAQIRCAFVFGSVARGQEDRESDLDLMVIGTVSLRHIVDAIGGAEAKLGRPINPTVYPPREFRDKLRAENHFLRTVMAEKMLFVLGDAHELATLSS